MTKQKERIPVFPLSKRVEKTGGAGRKRRSEGSAKTKRDERNPRGTTSFLSRSEGAAVRERASAGIDSSKKRTSGGGAGNEEELRRQPSLTPGLF